MKIYSVCMAVLLMPALFAQRSGDFREPADSLEFEIARLAEEKTSEGFDCSDSLFSGHAGQFAIKFEFSANMAYYFAVITGRSGNATAIRKAELAHTGQLTRKIVLDPTPFGAHFSLHAKRGGEQNLSVSLERKSPYRLLVCSIEISLYRMKQITPPLPKWPAY